MDVDVLIIGSGPAGASAAFHLNGYPGRVVVLERFSESMFPKYHSVCGEAVSDRMFRKAGIEPAAVVTRVDRIEISFPGGITVKVPVEGAVVDRPEMLAEIRGRCRAEFLRATATGVERDGDGFVVRTNVGEFRCRYLIGADGAHSVVRRDLFGTVPEMLPVVNNIVKGDGGTTLAFTVGQALSGFYRWRFPSKSGTVSVGSPKGEAEPEGTISSGARHIPFGGVPEAVSGNAMIVGDASGLANALCYGGIGAAMLSGRKAAEAVMSGRPETYGRWYSRSIYTNPHFMKAHRQFSDWNDEDISTAMRPFRRGYSVGRGFMAILRHPKFANVYFATWIAFKVGW